MSLVHRFPDTLLLVEKLGNEAANENSSATTRALAATFLDRALPSNADEHDVLLYIAAGAAHTRGRMQSTALNGLFFYSYVALLLQKLKNMRSTASKQHSSIFLSFLHANVPQLKTFSLPDKNV